MPKYETVVELPDPIKEFFNILTGQAQVRVHPSSGRVTLQIEAADLWDLAGAVHEIKSGLAALDPSFSVEVLKPVEVLSPGDRGSAGGA